MSGMCCALPNTADSRRGPVRNSPARGEGSSKQTTMEGGASAVRGEGSGTLTRVEHEKTQKGPQERHPWGLGGSPPDSGVPVSSIISEFIHRHFPSGSSSHTSSFAVDRQRPGLEEDTGQAED